MGSSAYGVSYPVAVTAPGQLVQVVGELGYDWYGSVLALVLGALVVGTGLERGTSRSAALTGAGWLRVLLAQGLAVCAVLVFSVVATYAVSAGASELAHLVIGSPVPSTVYSFPPAGQLAHALWNAMLISVCYGMVGCALAAITQSSSAAIILGLFLIYGLEDVLGTLAVTIPAVSRVELYDPENSVFTLTAMFGQPGGGGAELPNAPAAAAQTLGAWALGGALVFLTAGSVWSRRTSSRPRSRRLSASARVASLRILGSRSGSVQTEGAQTASPWRVSRRLVAGRWPGVARVLMTARSELFVLLRWPTVRALLLCAVLYPWLSYYAAAFFGYWLASPGASLSHFVSEFSAGQMLPRLLLDLYSDMLWTGTMPMLLIGAWAGGAIWPGGQLRTSLTQRQRRSEHALGQCLALVLLTIGTTILTFAVAAISVKLVALLATTPGRDSHRRQIRHLPIDHTHHRRARSLHARHHHIRPDRTRPRHHATQPRRRTRPGIPLGPRSRIPPLAAATPTTRSTPTHRRSTPRRKHHQAHQHLGPIAGYSYQGPALSVSTAALQLAGWAAIAIIITTWLTHKSEHA